MLIYVDDLKVFLEKFISLIWKIISDIVLGGLVRLVDMHPFPWARPVRTVNS